ncbi:hypothetical protein CIL05_07695 [Virgibacillus profundi]|uniref:Uncharacterized protein n=1 Tax=Virgibacillus profundi TaxID=2024555 RepID=A0A2A2IGT8_9BACI|nr:hypothetical protein [Virgibacillus profundi]PAV30345.1 hypothetical protein CIL05_07695 [Virgibacillus profundi]PXY54517.1 hypothetical protein CIT14_07780 [Virgibacillus profundi]
MNNNVILTDDELSLIMTSLVFISVSYDKYFEKNGVEGLDNETIDAYSDFKRLHEKLHKEYFDLNQ